MTEKRELIYILFIVLLLITLMLKDGSIGGSIDVKVQETKRCPDCQGIWHQLEKE